MSLQAALYARVSSEQQAQAQTIDSQVAALRERITQDGAYLGMGQDYVDAGYSGSTLIRPALERLRDAAAAGDIERLYILSPDRLARKYAYQVMLVDELQRAGVELVFINRTLGQSPEDELLLQVQGMIAEYERAKRLERSRRGKRHRARQGNVSVLSGEPYGYRYVATAAGEGQARYEVVEEQAQVVRQIFDWVGHERLSLAEVTRRPRLRAPRGGSLHPRSGGSVYDVPPADWLSVPVPALVSEDVFAQVQKQLAENRQRARRGQRGARYLLQGLVVCGGCGYAYYGKPISPSARKHHPREYAYYRCIGSDAHRFGGQRLCWNKQVRTDRLDQCVWQEVCRLLENPRRLAEEYANRLQALQNAPGEMEAAAIERQVARLRQGIERLIDAYAEGTLSPALLN
jgi:site-specific DNA recombinase